MKRQHLPSSAPDLGVATITQLTLTVFRLNGVLLQWGDQLVAPLGLTSARWQMLGAIALAGTPMSAPQVGAAMGVTRQGAQKQLNQLLELDLVEVHPNPAHRRSPLYALTPQGLTLYRKADANWATQAARLAALIPVAQASAATQTLESMLHELQTINPPSELKS